MSAPVPVLIALVWERRFTHNRKALKTKGGSPLLFIIRRKCTVKGDPKFGTLRYIVWGYGHAYPSATYGSDLAARVATTHYLNTGKWLAQSSPVIVNLDK